MEINLQSVFKEYREKIITSLNHTEMFLQNSNNVHTIDFDDESISKLEKLKNVIYFIELKNVDLDFLEKFFLFKKNNPKIKLPKINFENANSKILYVGKSFGDFKSGIKKYFYLCTTI